MLLCLLTVVCSVFYPASETYKAIKYSDKDKITLFGIYWAIFSFVQTIFYMIPFLQFTLLEILVSVIFVWIYHNDYMGGLFIRDQLLKTINANGAILNVINMLKGYVGVLGVFETETKTKSE